MINIFYRISDNGYLKNKPHYINNRNCLKNFYDTFILNKNNKLHIIADCVSDSTMNMIKNIAINSTIETTNIGNGAGTFCLSLDHALKLSNDDIVYFVEDDYIHKPSADRVLVEGFALKSSFITLYDHPDKYIPINRGGNPFCKEGPENTRVYLGPSCHWKITNSTTMTFATKVSILKNTENILRKWTNTKHPNDFEMFLDLKKNQHNLICPLPGLATHGETQWLCPFENWEKYI